jgi:transcription elongation factor GreA
MTEFVFTQDGLKKLAVELADLRRQRQRISERVREALDQGGAAEDPGWLDARREQERVDSHIAALEERRRLAIVVEPEADGEVDIGECVSVRELRSGALMDFRVVGSGEADPDIGDVSHESPIGSALLGRRAGEIVEVRVPNGAIRLEVVRVHD